MRRVVLGFALGFIIGRLLRVPTEQSAEEYDPFAHPFGEVVNSPAHTTSSVNWWLDTMGQRTQ